MALLGIDVGTSGTKVVLLDNKGKIIAKVTEEYDVSNPQPMWSEQHPLCWWSAVCKAVKKTLSLSYCNASEIKGIGLSGQMVGLVALDKNGEVIRPCILWNDQRSVKETEELTAKIGLNNILKETSNPLFATFVAPKLVWMRNNEPENYSRIAHVIMPKDYIAYKLTGIIGTEVSDASGTCLLNVKGRHWSKKMVNAMDIPMEWLPECKESQDVVGSVTKQASKQCSLTTDTLVIAGAGDQPAQAIGCGIVKAGRCSVTIGTSGVVFAQGDKHIEHPTGLLHSFCHSVPGQWYLMGVMLSAGGSFQWLRDMYSSLGSMDYNKMTSLAEKSPIGCEGLMFLPYLTGERVPHDDPRARGGWIGLTQRHKAEHLIRSVMEGITYGLCDSLMLITELGLPIERIYASGGAVRSRLWLQMLANIFNKEIVTTNITEGAAYGAAILAGVGTKQYANVLEATDELVKITDRFEPVQSSVSVYAEHYHQYRLLYPALKTSFSNLSELANKYSTIE